MASNSRYNNSVSRKCISTGDPLDKHAERSVLIMAILPRIIPPWAQEEDDFLHSNYLFLSHSELSVKINRTKNAVRHRCSLLGLRTAPFHWTTDEDEKLTSLYEQQSSAEVFDLNFIAQQMSRTRISIAHRSSRLGLTNRQRTNNHTAEARLEGANKHKEHYKIHGHPRGALGYRHTPETLAKLSECSKRSQAKVTPEQYEERWLKILKTKLERYGCAGPSFQTSSNPYSRTKSGKRADLGGRFFRSAWEANYARYLNYLVSQKQIKSWEYEPKTFVFHGTTRGVISYTPDFHITENSDEKVWHEVKGWMDAKSKAKLKKFAKFYPDEKLIVIASVEYKAISQYARLIEGWE